MKTAIGHPPGAVNKISRFTPGIIPSSISLTVRLPSSKDTTVQGVFRGTSVSLIIEYRLEMFNAPGSILFGNSSGFYLKGIVSVSKLPGI